MPAQALGASQLNTNFPVSANFHIVIYGVRLWMWCAIFSVHFSFFCWTVFGRKILFINAIMLWLLAHIIFDDLFVSHGER